MKFFVMQSSLLCITGEGGEGGGIVSGPTIHGGPFRGKNSHKAAYRERRGNATPSLSRFYEY